MPKVKKMTSLKKLVAKNRSYRRFYQEHKIERETILELIDLARLSPSARNQQALKFAIVNEQAGCEKIFSQLKWAGYLSDWQEADKGERPSAYIAVLADTNICKVNLASWIYTDLGIASQSILLGAVEKGLGGCIIAAVNRPKVAKILNLPENLEILAVLALGKPKENIIIDPIKNNDIKYWRDQDQNHHVPKRSLESLVI